MAILIRTFGYVALTAIALCLFLAWLVLKSPFLLEYRKTTVSDLLTNLMKSEVTVDGNVQVDLGSTIHINAERLKMPADTTTPSNVLMVARAEISFGLRQLLSGQFEMTGLSFDGVKADVVYETGDEMHWFTPQRQASESEASGDFRAFLASLSQSRFRANDVHLLIHNDDTGFAFDLQLDSLSLLPAVESRPMELRATGTINDEPVTIVGDFPPGNEFLAHASFSSMRFELKGRPGATAGDFETMLSLEVDEIQDLLSVLRLKNDLAGSASLHVEINQNGAETNLRNLDALIAFSDGETITLQGEIGNLILMDDMELEVDVQLYPADQQPKPAQTLRDLQLVGLNFSTTGSVYDAEDSVLRLMWNGLEIDTGGTGPSPIIVRDIRRTPDGLLELGDVQLLVGDPQAPILRFSGQVGNALELSDFDFRGWVDIHVASVLHLEDVPGAEKLGHIRGGLRLSEKDNTVRVSDVKARLEDSDLWRLSFTGRDASFTEETGIADGIPPLAFELLLQVPEADTLLTALGLAPVELSDIILDAKLFHIKHLWRSELTASAGTSRLLSRLELKKEDQKIKASGGLSSESVQLSDLSGVVAALLEIAKLEREGNRSSSSVDDREIQPLVLGSETEPAETPPDDPRPVQPLVLDGTEGTTDEPANRALDVSEVLADRNGLALSKVPSLQIINDVELLRELDLQYSIDIREVRGVRGVSSVKSELVSKNGQARLGPLNFNYGGGHFRLDTSIDVIDAPDILRISGSTGGWDFQKVLSALKVDIAGAGTLDATFNLSGNRRSVTTFTRSLNGSASVRMRDGRIHTSLIDLAGLGVLPWLFSSQRRSGYVDIVCLEAPLRISRGRVSSDPLVLETRDTQLVSKTEIDLRKKTIYLEGRPRKVGQPLSRSPWPFTVTGDLMDPEVRLRSLPNLQRRTDGATRMPEPRKPCVPDILQLVQ